MTNLKNSKLLWGIFSIVIIIVGVVMFMQNDIEHIEDTNGADNYALQQITDEDIKTHNYGALNYTEYDFSEDRTSGSLKSNKFTGVVEVYTENVVRTNQYEVTVFNNEVEAGNFKLVLLVDDKIVHEFARDELSETYTLGELENCTISLVMAGESADFSFRYMVY